MSANIPTNPKGNTSVHNALMPPIPSPCFDATSTTILSTARELIAASERLHDVIVRTIDPTAATFDNTVLPIIHEENKLLCERQLIEFLADVSPSEEIRQAACTAKRLFNEFDSRMSMRQDLYDLLFAVNSKAESMDLESRRLLDKLMLDSHRQGLAATSKQRERLLEIDAELNKIETEYLRHLQLAEHLNIRVAGKELEGVPQRFCGQSGNANCSGEDEAGLKVGDRMQLLNLLSHVKSHKVREKIYREYVSHHQSNATLFRRTIILRHEKAQILGYATYTEWSMAARMEKDPQRIVTFLQDLLTTVQPARDSIVEQWRLMKKEDMEALGEPDDDCLYVWDRPYYTKRMMERTFNLHSDTVKEYFPFEQTISCMLGIFGHLFGLRFVNTDEVTDPCLPKKELPTVWHDDVFLFAVWDTADGGREDPEFLGYLYMDLYRRPGKRHGFADLPICPVRTRCAVERVSRKELTATRDSFTKMDRALSRQQDWFATSTNLRRVSHASYSMSMWYFCSMSWAMEFMIWLRRPSTRASMALQQPPTSMKRLVKCWKTGAGFRTFCKPFRNITKAYARRIGRSSS